VLRRLTLVVLGGVLMGAGVPSLPVAEAAEVRGRVMSGSHPIGFSPVKLHRSGHGAKQPRPLARARTGRDGRFRLTYEARAARASAGAVLYLTAGAPKRAAAPTPAPPSSACVRVGSPRDEGRARLCRSAGWPRAGGAVRLASVLGSAPAPERVVINELTTVAAGYGLAQFIHEGGIRGRSPGLENAAAMSANLADATTGRQAGVLRRDPNGSQTSTLRTFNSLANLLAPCARAERHCARLLRLASPPDGPAPSGALQAIADIARNPTHNVERLFRLARSRPAPYEPVLRRSERPDAWTLALRFDGDGRTLDGPGNFAIDAEGNVWTLNNYEYHASPFEPACGSDLLIKFTPDGRFAPGSPYTGGGLSGAGYGITFDPDGDVWVGNYGFAGTGCEQQPAHNSVSKFTAEGRALSPDATEPSSGGFTEGSISWPQGTVSDRAGNIWIANCGNDSVTQYPNGNPAAARSLTGLGLEKPFDIAINDAGQAFVTAVGNDSVAMLNPDGSPTPRSPIRAGGLNRPMGIAVDSRGNMWVANSGLIDLPCPDAAPSLSTRGGSLTLIGRDGVPERPTAFTGGGLTIPWGITVDGDDHVWVANFGKKRISEFCGLRSRTCPPGTDPGDPISPNGTGYGFDGLVRNTGLAVDPSGNVWVANNWLTAPIQSNPGGHQVVVFVGIAAPLRTPLIGPPRR
jgi:hypothetical protein